MSKQNKTKHHHHRHQQQNKNKKKEKETEVSQTDLETDRVLNINSVLKGPHHMFQLHIKS